jgi:hypothetical protein
LNDVNRWAHRHHPFQKKIMLWYLLSWSTKWVLPTHGEEYRHRKKKLRHLGKNKNNPKALS